MSCNVVFCLDKHYARPCSVAVWTLCVNFRRDRDLRLHFLFLASNDIDEENVRELLRATVAASGSLALFHWHSLSVDTPYAAASDYISSATQLRLLIPDMFSELERVLYLDSDVVVLDDLSHLFSRSARGCLAARVDSTSDFMRLPGWSLETAEYPHDRASFNAGVLLFFPGRMRDFEAFRRRHPALNDQAVLNWYCLAHHENFDELPPRYNAVPPLIMSDPAIVHWALEPKPWMHRSLVPSGELWWACCEALDAKRESLNHLTTEARESLENATRLCDAHDRPLSGVDSSAHNSYRSPGERPG